MICFRQKPDAGSPLSSVVCLLVTGWLTKVDAIKWSASGALKRLLKTNILKSLFIPQSNSWNLSFYFFGGLTLVLWLPAWALLVIIPFL